MIVSISQQGRYMYIHGGYDNNPYVNMSTTSAGMVRYNGDHKKFEVYNGSTWLPIGGNVASVGLTPDAEKAIDWVVERIDKERQWKQLAEENKSVKLALENLNKAEEQLELIAILAKKEYDTEKTTS